VFQALKAPHRGRQRASQAVPGQVQRLEPPPATAAGATAAGNSAAACPPPRRRGSGRRGADVRRDESGQRVPGEAQVPARCAAQGRERKEPSERKGGWGVTG